MPSKYASSPNTHLVTMAIIALIIVGLYFMAPVVIPITLAILLTFLLAPVAAWLERHAVGRVTAAIMVVIGIFAFVLALGWVVAGQVVDLGEQLPNYRDNIQRKVESFKDPQSLYNRLSKNIKGIGTELSAPLNTTPTLATATPAAAPSGTPVAGRVREPEPEPAEIKPQPVHVVQAPPSTTRVIYNVLGPLLAPLATAGLILVLVFFMLLRRDDLRDRLIGLMGRTRLTVTTQALNEASQRVSRYLLMQLIVNSSYGIPVGIGLYLIGVPNAMLWGLLAIILRFIPYLGPWLAASVPILIALAVFDGWLRPSMTIALFITLEIISNNIVEPLLYGSSTGMSPVALIVAAAFWTWMWGPIGLVLSTPMTVCLVVLGRYVPQLEFLYVMLSDGPGLEPDARVYQRLLVLDIEDARRQMIKALATDDLAHVYDTTLLPAMRQAQQDRTEGAIDPARLQLIMGGVRDIVEDLGEESMGDSKKDAQKEEPEPVARPTTTVCIASVGARDESDEIAAMMLSQVLEAKGYCVKNASLKMPANEAAELAASEVIDIVCISALPPLAELHARYICKRLRPRNPNLRIIVGLWTATDESHPARERLGQFCDDNIATSFSQAIETIDQIIPSVQLQEQMTRENALKNAPGRDSGASPPASQLKPA